MRKSPTLLQAIVSGRTPPLHPLPSLSEAIADVDAIIVSFQLQHVRRYFNQIHWLAESHEAAFSDRIEPGLKLENVAAHSWHVADAALLLLPHFATLNRERVLSLSILHDKLEIFTGDFDPIGPDGKGTYSHAFNLHSQQTKISMEQAALENYLLSIRESARSAQRDLLLDAIYGNSWESRFVKSIDKLQALAYVLKKKDGNISDEHLVFSIRYSKKALD